MVGEQSILTSTITPFLAGVCTLGIYSFLYRENSVYRFFEHIFIGIATAWGLVVTIQSFLWPRIFKPMVGADIQYLPDGVAVSEYDSAYLLYIIPTLFSLLYYTMYSKKYRHIAQLVISFQLGCAGGLVFKGLFVEVLPQIYDCFKPLWFGEGVETNLELISNFVFVVTLISAFSYFFFTFKASGTSAMRNVSNVGRYMMMGCFGAFFGATMMARMALLAERLNFLTHDWIDSIKAILGMVS